MGAPAVSGTTRTTAAACDLVIPANRIHDLKSPIVTGRETSARSSRHEPFLSYMSSRSSALKTPRVNRLYGAACVAPYLLIGLFSCAGGGSSQTVPSDAVT